MWTAEAERQVPAWRSQVKPTSLAMSMPCLAARVSMKGQSKKSPL
jgi:hypothetical protein